MKNIILTVFTPTYNRGHLLERLYRSLTSQTCTAFEWIIVDDGSTDNTEAVINGFIQEQKLTIGYEKQVNMGKMAAHNRGVQLARGVLFACVDSDDWLSNNAVDCILRKWERINNNKDLIGILAQKVYPDGREMTYVKPGITTYFTLRAAYDQRMVGGETFLIYRTEIIKKEKFPVIPQEVFVPESYLYDRLDYYGRLCLLDEPLYIADYLDDGLSKNMDRLIYHNPQGYLAFLTQRINLRKKGLLLFKDLIRYQSLAFVYHKTPLLYPSHPFLSAISLPFGAVLSFKRFRKK